MEMLQATILSLMDPMTLILVIVGVSSGLFIGAMPGLTATMALAVLLPFTFTMSPLHGLVSMGAVYMGSIYGGCFAAILVNTPGTPSAIATALEGYPMAKAGKAEEAIGIATVSSVIGGLAGVAFLLLLAPPLAKLSLKFGSAEYFWVAMMGVSLIAGLSGKSLLKGLLAGTIGMFISTIGVSPIGGETRFTFGIPDLQGGIAMIIALIGLFVVPELFNLAGQAAQSLRASVDDTEKTPLLKIIKLVLSQPVNLIRSACIGEVVSVIPGAGGSISSLASYNEAKRASRTPEKFGTGHHEGLVAAETSNNVTVAGSMVPLLTLGIPGAPPDAIILGVLMMHGLRPGMDLFTASGELTYAFILSMGLGALALLPVGLLGGRLIYRVILKTPYYILVPSIALVTILGSFALRNSMTDVLIMIICGIFGYIVKQFDLDPAAVVLGLILGGIAEEGFVQTMLRGMGEAHPTLMLFDSSMSKIIIVLILFTFFSPYFSEFMKKRKQLKEGGC